MMRRPRVPRRGLIIGAVIALILLAVGSARFYTDILWFREVGLSSVLWKSLTTQFLVGLIVGLSTAAIVFVNLWTAARLAPAYRVDLDFARRPTPFDQYRTALTPYLLWIRIGIAGLVGLLSGFGASAAWRTFLLWANGGDFGIEDPQFGRDVGFYVFNLPFYEIVLGWIWFALIASLLLSVASHYFYGSVRPEARLAGVMPGALAHISVLMGLLALVKTGQYWLGQYQLNFSPRGVVTGASYTDVHAQLPALRLLMLISVISAVLFLVNIRFRRISLPLAAIGIWLLVSILAGGVWPLAVQRFSVEPQEPQREQPYIERNLVATTEAFDLGGVETKTYPALSSLEPEAISRNTELLQNVRVWDPGVLQQAYSQLQALRTYYEFRDVDIDRYEIDGEIRQVLLSARELSVEDLPDESQKWANTHLQYTHGFGLVASLANSRTTAGQPAFLVRDVPGTVLPGAEALNPGQPRIYFGEAFADDEYSIVNSKQAELDYEGDGGAVRSSYEGQGGIGLGLLNELAFAIRFGDPNFVLSGLIRGDSRVLIYREVRSRVHRAAPFLQLDRDPYPAVIDGRLVWIVDGYTSTRWYPYSQRFDATGVVPSDTHGFTLSGNVNYVRNSVKVVIDAYEGTMTFYIVEDDPLIEAWARAFPELFSDEGPSPELEAHFRYPEDLFLLQTEVYRTYHIPDALDFYAKQDAWDVSEQAAIVGNEVKIIGEIEPTYLLFQLPGETSQEFMLTRPFSPRRRPNMVSFMTARSDPENYGELVVLQFPRNITVPGPVQVDNFINQDVEISRQLTLLGQRGSMVSFGSLVILPIEDSILYVQPLFVTAESAGIPELKRIFMVMGEEAVMEATFEEALASLFDLEDVTEPPPEEPTEPKGPEQATLEDLIARAGRLYDQAQEALSEGDFETYGRLIEQLGRLLERAEALTSPRR